MDDGLFDICYEKADDLRKKKIDSLKKRDDRNRSLAAGMLCLAAAEKAGLFGEDAVTAGDPRGKLFFPKRPELSFSISHTGDRVILALSELPVGCDVEYAGRDVGVPVMKAFAPTEREYILAAGSEEEKRQRIIRVFTLKESFVKAVGEGLSGFKSFGISFDGEDRPALATCDERVAFWERVSEGYRTAVCVIGDESVETETVDVSLHLP